jgi:hypothetical protein
LNEVPIILPSAYWATLTLLWLRPRLAFGQEKKESKEFSGLVFDVISVKECIHGGKVVNLPTSHRLLIASLRIRSQIIRILTMMSQREAFTMAARRKMIPSFGMLRRTRTSSSAVNGRNFRNLSSATPLFEEEHEQATPNWTKNPEELKQILEQHQAAAKLQASDPADYALNDGRDVSAHLANGDAEPVHAMIDTEPSPTELTYTGDMTIPITTELRIITPEEDAPSGVWPIFRLMVSSQKNCLVAIPPFTIHKIKMSGE